VDHTYSLFNYQKGNQVQDVLSLIKYQQKTRFAQFLGAKLAEQIPKQVQFDFIIPVPLHPKKKKLRGFNQSALIAKGIQERINVPVNERILKRVAHNPSQTTVTKYERWENVKDIFKLIKPSRIEGRHVLLVDDVLTTGATIEACLKQLLTVDGCSVSVATLAVRI
jgi:ComF family protein